MSNICEGSVPKSLTKLSKSCPPSPRRERGAGGEGAELANFAVIWRQQPHNRTNLVTGYLVIGYFLSNLNACNDYPGRANPSDSVGLSAGAGFAKCSVRAVSKLALGPVWRCRKSSARFPP
jgi:hypothetical protein